MWWFIVIVVAGTCSTCSYIIGDYFGFRRGKQDSYLLWHKRVGRVWTEPGPQLRD